MLKDYIKIIKPYIVELFSEDSSGHDISHLTRTMNIAVNLARKKMGMLYDEMSRFSPIVINGNLSLVK